MNTGRLRFIEISILLLLLVVIGRLFYWQVLANDTLAQLAESQRESITEIPASRGKILAADGFPLVGNQPAYTTFVYMPDFGDEPYQTAQKLAALLAPKPEDIGATPSAEIQASLVDATMASIAAKLTNPSSSWIPLSRLTLETNKQAVASLNIKGIGFDAFEVRHYPEASMAAHLLGFVGSDGSGKPKGYFGVEGKYNFELTGRPGYVRQEKDALGKPIVTGEYADIKGRDGRTLQTHIDRGLQFMVEQELKKGVEKYQATSGEAIIVDPKTGSVITMAIYPTFEPAKHRLYTTADYKNPSITDTYEPGSTFKTLIMAAGINESVISPDSRCDSTCDGPVQIGKYAIKTWNNEYNPGQTMTEVLERSDNTGMVFIARKLGKDKMLHYLDLFGITAPTNIDLEGEVTPRLRPKWGDIDIATASFGQGIALNTMQMLMAVSSLANEGKLMEPHVVAKVYDGGEPVDIAPKVVRQVVSKETAKTMAAMMQLSAQHGDAKWAVPRELEIAGKTGTAQIPIDGHYDKEKTIASFVGFAPASNPRFAMIVKLKEPQTSPWASETAAPLWFTMAKQIFQYYAIPTQNTGGSARD